MVNSNDLFRQIFASGPSQSTFFLLLLKMKEEGKLDEVIQVAFKALRVYPEDTRLKRLLAEAYFEKGLIAQAETELEKVASDIRDMASVYKLLARIYIQQNRGAEASQALKRYLAHYPGDKEAQNALAGLLEAKQRHSYGTLESDDLVRKMEDLEPPAYGTGETGAALQSAPGGNRRQEDDDLDFFDSSAPDSSETGEELPDLATPTLAEIYYNQGQVDEAINTYKRFLAKNPSHKEAQRRLEELKKGLERPESQKERTSSSGKDKRAEKERLITSLEGWLSRLKEQ